MILIRRWRGWTPFQKKIHKILLCRRQMPATTIQVAWPYATHHLKRMQLQHEFLQIVSFSMRLSSPCVVIIIIYNFFSIKKLFIVKLKIDKQNTELHTNRNEAIFACFELQIFTYFTLRYLAGVLISLTAISTRECFFFCSFGSVAVVFHSKFIHFEGILLFHGNTKTIN